MLSSVFGLLLSSQTSPTTATKLAPGNHLIVVLVVLLIGIKSITCSELQEFGNSENDTPVIKRPGHSGLEVPLLEWIESMSVQDPSKRHVKTMLAEQEPFDFNPQLTAAQIIRRSGFDFETYNSTSDDGYVTQLIRIKNPLARPDELKYPPVVLYGGQGVSPAVFIMASINKHHPVVWPPNGEWSGGHRANRSLAFTLSNNGYDVWLVPARGVDQQNRARSVSPKVVGGATELAKAANIIQRQFESLVNGTASVLAAGGLLKMLRNPFDGADYWSFSSDEIARFELKNQLDLVMRVSGQDNIALITYSNGAFITHALLACEPAYGLKHIDTLISIAPAVYVNKYNVILGVSGVFGQLTPPGMPFVEDHIHMLARSTWIHMCKGKLVRYSICKFMLDSLYGQSDTFNTFLELSIFDYIGRPQSTKGLRQTLQNSYWGHMRRYDNGLIGNLFAYGRMTPPDYRLNSIILPRMYLFAGEKDLIADVWSVKKLASELGRQPIEMITVPGMNHLDMLVAWNVDKLVNGPILRILDDRYIDASYYPDGEYSSTGARSLNSPKGIKQEQKPSAQGNSGQVKQLQTNTKSKQPDLEMQTSARSLHQQATGNNKPSMQKVAAIH